MTRYARAGKGTHQRVAKDSTPWDELKPPPPQRQRNNGHVSADESGPGRFVKKDLKERFTKSNSSDKKTKSALEDSDLISSGDAKANGTGKRNSNVRGYGQSKSVKIFGQFWVPIEDARRLKGLLKKLKSQGLPRKEILEALKNDRRKAEKAAKRQRDKTCFQCRQFGHVLSDCPNLKKAIATPGSEVEDDESGLAAGTTEQGLICFKCGSTEHTSRNCRKKGENFEFAKCFVCSGTGHIARQCPKNTRGIYPSGGNCSECGSTTHLKKDCPDLVGKEEHLSQDDSDAVLPSLSDPFSSTEYEPIFEVESDKEDESHEDTFKSDCSKKQEKLLTKSKKKRKRNKDEDSGSTFEFNTDNNNAGMAASKKLFSSDPKKRKIVKF